MQKFVKTLTIVHLHLIDLGRMEFQKEQGEESKKAFHRFYCSRDSMNRGGQNLWNVVVIHAMSRIFCQMRNSHERRSDEQRSGPIIPSGAEVEHHPISAKDQARFHQFGKKVLPGLFMGHASHAGDAGKETYS